MNDANSLHPKEWLPVVAVFLGVAIAAGLGAADLAAAAASADRATEALVPGCGAARRAPRAATAPCDLTPTSSDPLVLAEIQVWHGLCTHSTAFSGWFPYSRAYDSLDWT